MTDGKPEHSDLRDFCVRSLRLLGASAEDGPGPLRVEVTSSLAGLFEGRESLHLVFKPDDMTDGCDLVTPGSYVLDRIIAAVQGRGETARVRVRPALKISPSPHIAIANATVSLVEEETVDRALLFAGFRVSLLSDEDQDHLHYATVDLQTARPSRSDARRMLSMPLDPTPWNPDLPEGTLEKAMESARGEAEEAALRLATPVQREIEERLAAEIARLQDYYDDLAEDMLPGDSASDARKLRTHERKAAAARADLLDAYAVVRPFVEDAGSEAELVKALEGRLKKLWTDRYGLRAPLYWRKDTLGQMAQIDRERSGIQRLIDGVKTIARENPRDRWLAVLDGQRDDELRKLEARFSRKASRNLSPERRQSITEDLAAEEEQRVSELREKARLTAMVEPVSAALIAYPCLRCGYTAAGPDGAYDFEVVHNLVTGEVEAPICDSCGAALTDAWLCSCGHLACPQCRKTCKSCGKSFCARCLHDSCRVCGAPLCEECRLTCAGCGKIVCAEHSGRCRACGMLICSGGDEPCARTCAVCGETFDKAHVEECPTCGKPVCANDMVRCSKCGAKACRADIPDCSSCGEPTCAEHTSECSICGQSVCASCMTPDGRCSACANLFAVRTAAPAIVRILAEVAGIQADPRRRWYAAESERRFILLCASVPAAVYVVDKHGSRLISQRRLGLLHSVGFLAGINRPSGRTR